MDVIGVGDIDIDIYLDVDHIPGRDEKVLATRTNFYPGGMVANFLVALQRLGSTCGFHGVLGDDAFGRIALQDMADNGVDVSAAIVKPNGQTYFCVVMLDHTGEKSLIVAPTACMELAPEEVSEEAISKARHMHTTLSHSAATALEYATRYGLTTSVDFEPGSIGKIGDIKGFLAKVDIAFVNHKAAALLGNTKSLRATMQSILSLGPKIVCVTMGRDGLALMSRGDVEPLTVDSFPVDTVDTTGAGDCFAAGFIHGYLNGWDLRSAATFASATAALSIKHYGGHAGAPNIDEVTSFLAERNWDLA